MSTSKLPWPTLGYIVDEKYPPQYHLRFSLKKTLSYRILIPKKHVDWAVLNDNPDTKLRGLPFVYDVWEEGHIEPMGFCP